MTDFNLPESAPVEPVAFAPEAVAVPEGYQPVVAPLGGEVLTLPSGFKVALRNPKAIRNRERRVILAGITGDTANAVGAGFDILARIQSALIVGWDVQHVDDALVPSGPVLPIPSAAPESLDDLPLSDANALDTVAQEVQKLLFPNFGPDVDPASPTKPSAG